ALVTLVGIQVFFDILVPDGETPDECKEKDHTLVLTWDIEMQSQELERAYHLNILEWMWERMTGKFERKEEIIKWKYRGKIGAKSENDYIKKYPVKTPEKGEDPEEKEYMGGPIKIKISAEEDFTSSFLELPGCVPIDV
ncbi:hypothetical protein C1646_678030, partial [Rhizophagus diaphanus]